MNDPFRHAVLGSWWSRACCLALCTVIVLAILVPTVSPWAVDDVDWEAIDQAPGAAHWFGTDGVGRDLLTRSFSGARVSIAIALLATGVSVLIGLPYGAVAGFLGGRVDQVMMRIVDALYALPFVLFVILLIVVFGRNPYLLFIALGAVSWLDLARIVRGQTLAVRREAYVDAARALGAGRARIVIRHVLPNVLGPAVVYATLTIPGVILAESFISFLGLGIQEPDTSWGVLIADGARAMQTSWWQLVFPATLLAVTLLACNVLGDRLRDALDRRDGVHARSAVAAAGATPRPSRS